MPIACGGVSVNPGDIILADPDGVIVIPRKDAAVILEDAKKFQAADEGKLAAAKDGTAKRGWVEKSLEAAPLPIEVMVRPIEPMGKLLGYASVNIGGIVVDDFKVVDGKNGLFLSPPSKESNRTRSGYRATTRVTSRALQERLDALTVDAYNTAVQTLVARAEAVRPAPIREQMAQAAREADKANASRPAPERGKEARDDR